VVGGRQTLKEETGDEQRLGDSFGLDSGFSVFAATVIMDGDRQRLPAQGKLCRAGPTHYNGTMSGTPRCPAGADVRVCVCVEFIGCQKGSPIHRRRQAKTPPGLPLPLPIPSIS
jgi:hypothetical protein